MRQYEEPMHELEHMFEIDLKDNITRLVSSVLDEGIEQEEKQEFYKDEVGKLFSEIVNKDVEKASLRMFESGINHATNYDFVTGELIGIRDELS